MQAGKIRIVLVDDHPIITDGVSSLFEDHEKVQVTGIFNVPEEALKGLESLDFDLVMSDMSMPGLSGSQLIRHVRKHFPHKKIVVFSMFADKAAIAEAIQSGADGYILKSSGKQEIEQAIYSVMEGKKSFPVSPDDEVLAEMVNAKSQPARLSERELEILKLVAGGLSSKEIADKIFLSEFTVNTHRRNMLKKTGQPNVAALMRYAQERRWIM